jgi:hypothetical protein
MQLSSLEEVRKHTREKERVSKVYDMVYAARHLRKADPTNKKGKKCKGPIPLGIDRVGYCIIFSIFASQSKLTTTTEEKGPEVMQLAHAHPRLCPAAQAPHSHPAE